MNLRLIDRPSPGAAAAALLVLGVLVGGCSRQTPAPATPETSAAADATASAAEPKRPDPNPDRNAYFGDVHVHTGWSFDALTNGSRTTPADAYAWAQGQEITNSGFGGKIQIHPRSRVILPCSLHGDLISQSGKWCSLISSGSSTFWPASPLSVKSIAMARSL